MSSVATTIDNQLALVFQYTVEAYKTFQKLAELLPNPSSAAMFKSFAADERHLRDLIEIKYLSSGGKSIPVTLGNDLRFQDMLEGDLSDREKAEMLLSRERTMEKKLRESIPGSPEVDRNLILYIAAAKRSHMALLERELALTQIYSDWFKREDAQDLIVHGRPS